MSFSTISSTSSILRPIQFFSPEFTISTWTKRVPSRNPKICSPISPFRNTARFRISAQFGRRTNRQNYLRKKLNQQQERQQEKVSDENPIFHNPKSDHFQFQSENSDEKNKTLVSDTGLVGNTEESVIELKTTKPLGESVLWNKLESWVEQYKKDTAFWGFGTAPIFTVFQDSEGKVERVVVAEDEILKRSRIDPALFRDAKVEDYEEVKAKISVADVLATEMERGKNVLPKNSTVAKFLISGENLNTMKGVEGFTLNPSLSKKLPRIAMLVFCGFIFIWAAKKMFTAGNSREEYTSFEKEMLRRKIKARKEKERNVKGDVEVILGTNKPDIISLEKPLLNKQELISSIKKATASDGKLALPEQSQNQQYEDAEYYDEIQEIRKMARHAREVEKADSVPADNGAESGDHPASIEISSEKEVVEQKLFGDISQQRGLNGYAGHARDLSGSVEPIDISNNKDHNQVLPNLSSAVNSELRTSNRNLELPDDIRSSMEAVHDLEHNVSSIDGTELNNQSIITAGQSGKPSETSVTSKSKIILSVKEAREYLSRKSEKLKATQEKIAESVEEVEKVSSPLMEIGDVNQKSDRPGKELDSLPLSLTSNFASEDSTFRQKEYLPTSNSTEAAQNKGQSYSCGPYPSSYNDESHRYGEITPLNLLSPEQEATVSDLSSELTDEIKICLQSGILETSGSASLSNPNQDKKLSLPINDIPELVDNGVVHTETPETRSHKEGDDKSADLAPSLNKGSWLENNFHEFEPVIKKIQTGFRDNYKVAKEKSDEELTSRSQMFHLETDANDSELEWMKDEKLTEIVFKVRENELAGKDPFHLMDDGDKLLFFGGLEKKVEQENKQLLNVHEWLHSNIENLNYGADGISLYDPPEKVIPRWKGPPMEKTHEFLNDFVEQRKVVAESIKKSNLIKEERQLPPALQESPSSNKIDSSSAISTHDAKTKSPKTIIESSDGSIRAGKKSGKEFWQHTKKWSQGFLDSYNEETDPEIKAVMKDMGKDLDRWITEREIQEAGNLMDTLPEKGKTLINEKINRVKREMELFGPQAVVSKYREYADEKEEDYLWWLDLPCILCIELYTKEEGGMKVGFYSLEMAADLELDPKQYHVIAFENAGDCKNLCYIIQAHMEMLGNGNAFVVARPPKDAFREAKANGFSVTVIKKGTLQLNVDQTLEEVEEAITEIGSKIYHDKIMRERSLDVSTVMKGLFATEKPTKKRRRSKRKVKRQLKRPTSK